MLHRLRGLVGFVLASRRSPDMRVRTLWWVAAFVILGLTWLQPALNVAVTVVWLTVNCCYMVGAIAWCLVHPRSLLSVREISLRWSVLLTLFAALVLFSQLYRFLDQVRPTTEGPNPLTAVLVVVVVLVCPVLFTLILGFGLLGAMVGAFAMRRSPNQKQATRSAVVFWFIASTALALWATASPHHSDLRQLYSFSIPLLTVAFCRLADGPQSPLTLAGHRLVQRVEALLILRRLRRGRWRTLDLRGAALGLLAAVMMLAAPRALISPLKTLALTTLIQVRAASAPHIHFGTETPFAELGRRNDIVILNLDPATRYTILHGSSEAAIQAAMIRKLRGWGVREIVLPAPLVDPKTYEPVTTQASPDAASIARCRHDLPALAAAVQCTDATVITTMPPRPNRFIRPDNGGTPGDSAPLQPLYRQSRHVAAAELPLSDAVGLPIIPTRASIPYGNEQDGAQQVPILIAKDRQKHRDPLQSAPMKVAGMSQLGEFQLPLISSEGVLVNFLGRGPHVDFMHIDYSTLLHDEMIHANSQDRDEHLGESNWQTPAKYFQRGQVVLLDSVLHPLTTTPLGNITEPEVLAYATATLLSGSSIRPVTSASLVVITLLMGLCIGGACFRRDPLDALWRATIPLFLIALTSLSLFEFGGIWLDPVLPLGTACIALTMVTQLSFAQERSERRRTRALFQRFVASDQLDNWLAMPEDALALGGKRQTVCVLFADVRNFTHFAEQNEADRVIEVINAYMSGLTDALHRHRGVLDKYTGDGLMAWFPVKDNPYADLKNAVEAALAMRDAALAITMQMPPDRQLDIGIGLHYGDAVVGLVGNEKLQINWTALGHTVVVSARLQTIASGGEVVISESLYEVIAGAFAVVEGAPVMVKGLSIPVRPYRVIGASPE